MLLIPVLLLGLCSVGLRSAQVHNKVNEYELHAERDEVETNLQIIQMQKTNANHSLLSAQALMAHLEVLKMAMNFKLHMYETDWDLRDICKSPLAASAKRNYFIEQLYKKSIPCTLITPLDCFWEGSELLLPETAVAMTLAEVRKLQMNDPQVIYEYGLWEAQMRLAANATTYGGKPCLNPRSTGCPNNHELQSADVGAILQSGCAGYANKYMHWPVELIVGGAEHNEAGVLDKVKTLQTLVPLMSAVDFYNLWHNHTKVQHLDWTPERAALLWNVWQRNFSNAIESTVQSKCSLCDNNDFKVLTPAILEDISKENTPNFNAVNYIPVVVINIIYAACVHFWSRQRQSLLAASGVLLNGIATAAGLVLCKQLGIAADAHALPCVVFSLGVHHVFMLTAKYEYPESERTTLKHVAGTSILANTCVVAISLFAAIFISAPASHLRVVCQQVAVVMCFNLNATLLHFRVIIYWKQKFRRAVNSQNTALNNKVSSNNTAHSKLQQQEHRMILPVDTLAHAAFNYIPACLMKRWMKYIIIIPFIGTLICSLYATKHLQYGADLINLDPKHTNPLKFVNNPAPLFDFYSIYAVTQGNFAYPTNQRLLHEYHEAFVRVPHVIKHDNGGLPDFWLTLFRDWLINLQRTFDREFSEGRLTREGWLSNATSDAILAYKLLVQSGYVDNPVDKFSVIQNRLVDSEGIINPKAFYNYLSAWATNDVFAYGASQCKLNPHPHTYYHINDEIDLKIPQSKQLLQSQFPLYLHGLSDLLEVQTLVNQLRAVSAKFEARGLPNMLRGTPFELVREFEALHNLIALTLCITLVATFITSALVLHSAWLAFLVVFNVFAALLQILCAMAMLDIKVSAISAVVLILSVGMFVCLTVHISLCFITSLGDQQRRMQHSIATAIGPIINSLFAFTLTAIVLAITTSAFPIQSFLQLILIVFCVGACDALIIFPIILSICSTKAVTVSAVDLDCTFKNSEERGE